MLDNSSFGHRLMKWAGQHFTSDQKQNIGAGSEYGHSMMRKYLAQVGEQYTKIKCRPIDKVIYLEDVIIFEGIGTYEYHPFAALAFLSLLYGVMLTDDNRKEHHRIPDKADYLLNFLDDKFPQEAREIRNIVLCNDPNVSIPVMDADKYLDEAECSLHSDFRNALLRRYMNGNTYANSKTNITINSQEYVANKGDQNMLETIKLTLRADETKCQTEKENASETEYTEIQSKDDIDETLSKSKDKEQIENTINGITPITNDFYNCHVYVSYPWSDSALMDDLCTWLQMRKIDYFRDKDICGFRKNIQKFEEEIGNGKIVIAIINEHSMESIDCMYEVCALASNGHLNQRLFPIVDLPGMKRDSKACEEYLKIWDEKEKDLLKRYSTNSGDKVNELRELKYINCIKTEFPKFWDYISKYNTSTLESLQKDNWKILLDEVERNIK